jgi:hypothetical protein
MAAPQSAPSRPSQSPSPELGDIAPSFRLMAKGGEAVDPGSDLVSGKLLLLLFCPKGAGLPAEAEGLGQAIVALDGRNVVAAPAGAHETPAPAGYELAFDADGAIFRMFNVLAEPRIVLIAPNRHILYMGADADAARAALARIAPTRQPVVMAAHPPVLVVPDVFSRADCQRLINIFAMQGQVFVEPGHDNLPAGNHDVKQRIPDYGRQDRIDHWIRQPETVAFINDRLGRRLLPEIEKSFQFKITRHEAYRIGSYQGERGGELHGHRDNTHPKVAHRKFACSINLNTEQFEGGELRFPEFGNQLYRPETGAGIVFSSSLLHEPLHVTSGRRFVLLCFLY